MYALIQPLSQCIQVENRLTQICVESAKWKDGITDRYGYIESLTMDRGAIPVLEGYEMFFSNIGTPVEYVNELPEDFTDE